MILTLLYILAGLIVLASLIFNKQAQKYLNPKNLVGQHSWRNQLTNPLTAIAILAVVAAVWILIKGSWALVQGFVRVGHWLSATFSGLNWSAVVVGIVLVAVAAEAILYSKYNSGDQKNKAAWKQYWKAWRGKFYFALLWTFIVTVINLLMKHFDFRFWWALWLFKGEGAWPFWLINGLLIAGIVLAVNTDKELEKVKTCGTILFAVGLFFWVVAYNDYHPGPKPGTAVAAASAPDVPPPGPSSRWSDANTHPTKRVEWSVPISPTRYEVDAGMVEVMLDGNDNPAAILHWDVKDRPSSEVQFKVPSYVKSIQIRSRVKDITVYGYAVEPPKGKG